MLTPLSIDNFEFDEDGVGDRLPEGYRSKDQLTFTFDKNFLIDLQDNSESLWIRFKNSKAEYYYWSREKKLDTDCHFAHPSDFWIHWAKDYRENSKRYRSEYGTKSFREFLLSDFAEENFTFKQLITDLVERDSLLLLR